MSDEFDLDAWLDDYQPIVVEVKVVQKANLIADLAHLEQAWKQARAAAREVMHDSALVEAEAALRACEAEIVASEKVFKFQGVGHEPWQKLKRKYPPTEQQRAEGDDVNLDSWSPAVIAECSCDPKITLPQAQTLMRKLPPGEFAKLLEAVGQANGQVAGAPKSVLAALTERSRLNAGSPTTELPEESLDVDSSGTLADPAPG